MDVVAACRAFVHVSERGSFTVGAAAARMSQSVASRRVAALERHLGERLLDRTARRAILTPFGRELLPAARRLVRAAEVLEHEARTAVRRPLRLAVPSGCGTAALARLVADGRRSGVALELRAAAPPERAELLHSQEVRAALLAVPPAEATWRVELGLASVNNPGVTRVYVETLRPGRTDRHPPRRIWLQPEDDVPHVRDRLARLCEALGLRPAQYTRAADLPSAAAEVYGSADLLLCSATEADELGLHRRPIGETSLARGYIVGAAAPADADRVRDRLADDLARCLGAETTPAGASRADTAPGGTDEATQGADDVHTRRGLR